MSKLKHISNWGNFPVVEAEEIKLQNGKLPFKLLKDTPVIPRGNARCYGDAALNDTVISTLALKHFLEFNEINESITCESGVLFSDVLEFIVPKGFFLPVTPGTKFITVGGAIAADIHGKNHHIEGCFSEFVSEFKLLTTPQEIVTCSRTKNSELFWETIGGMGLTGIILSATFKLKPIETSFIKQESIKAKNLDEVFKIFKTTKNSTYTVAWIDCLKKGKHLGRSILIKGEHAVASDLNKKQLEKPLKLHSSGKLKIPFFFPSFVLNTFTVKVFNILYYFKQFKKATKRIVHYDSFFYPLDAIHKWNKIYGKNGFIQYQFVVGKDQSKAAMKEVLQAISKSGQGSFLAVLKLFGKGNTNAFNSFPVEGYTLALDFKVNKKVLKLIPVLDAIVLKYGGRVYRAKDSCSNPKLTNYVTAYNPNFDSHQNKRIKTHKTI
jgi:decaprenylphospho-beta-D-ribofuranose 2-oxidase